MDWKKEFEELSEIWKQNKLMIDQLNLKIEDLKDYTLTADENIIKYKQLQKENNVLNHLLKQYESTLDIIMKKFRLQTILIQKEKQSFKKDFILKLEKEQFENEELRQENKELKEKLLNFVSITRELLKEDDETESLVVKLQTENETLRKILSE
ncbi:hypothetical protein HK103_006667 [Boothiomyces macroporosus]|uniref:Uncharacterized protein n=1 Tax=Boothiomyces macroporosus TaxID=261099 RepID=A0AAD5UDG0_9FUNG|nr:hypothetical protein HK103_006667 [Boothiomyces macroporosus]